MWSLQIASLEGSRAVAAALVPRVGLLQGDNVAQRSCEGDVDATLEAARDKIKRIIAAYGLTQQEAAGPNGDRWELVKCVRAFRACAPTCPLTCLPVYRGSM